MKKLFFILSFLFMLGITGTTFTSCSSEDIEDVISSNEEDPELKCSYTGMPTPVKICGVKIDIKEKKAYVLTWAQPGYEVERINWGRGTDGRLGHPVDIYGCEIASLADFDLLPPAIGYDNASSHKVYRFNWREEFWDGGTYRFILDGIPSSSSEIYTVELPCLNGDLGPGDNPYRYSLMYLAHLYHYGPRSNAYSPTIKVTLKLNNTTITKTFDYGIMRYGDLRQRDCSFSIPYGSIGTLEIKDGKDNGLIMQHRVYDGIPGNLIEDSFSIGGDYGFIN